MRDRIKEILENPSKLKFFGYFFETIVGKVIISFVYAFLYYTFVSPHIEIKVCNLLIFFVILVIIFLILRRAQRTTPTSKGKLGIVISIDYKNMDGYEIFSDFIDSIKQQISSDYQVILLNRNEKKKIGKGKNIDKDYLFKLNKKIKGVYRIIGDVRKSKSGGVKCFFDLEGRIFHREISKEISKELIIDFSSIFPRQVNFDENYNYDGIKFSGAISAIVARYIVGVAAYISGDPFLGWEQHKDLQFELEKFSYDKDKIQSTHKQDYIKLLAKKIKVIQYTELRTICNYLYYTGDITSWTLYIKERSVLVDKFGITDGSFYVQKAIYLFLVENEIQEARKMIKISQKHNFRDYRYSLVFLDLYDEKFLQATQNMRSILKKHYKGEQQIVQEVVQFILGAISKNIGKSYLYYRISLLYLEKLDNYPMAYDYLQKYEKMREAKYSIFEIQDIKNMKAKMEKIMSLSN